jgi:hypothetical protein
MKVFWILMAIISVENADYKVYTFDNITFENEMACIQFAQENYQPINDHVNVAHDTVGTLYDFACVSSEEYKILLDSTTEK